MVFHIYVRNIPCVMNELYIIPFLVETAADPLTQSSVHRAVINQEHDNNNSKDSHSH